MPTVQEVEHVFFEAMQEGWASNAVKNGTAKKTRKIEIPDLPGYKGLVWEDGPWKVLDRYAVYESSPWSAGSISISHEGKTLWVMHFGGWYAEEAIPTLKIVLQETYRRRKFFGGRGLVPAHFDFKGGHYVNYHNEWKGSLEEFSGMEWMTKDGQTSLGFHRFQGFSLLPRQ